VEHWLPIEDFPSYEISSEGRVRNVDTDHILSIHPNGRGIYQVVMYRDGRPNARAVHKLVANAFVETESRNYRGDDVPVHIDGDRSNNCADNLMWKPLWLAMQRTRQRNRVRPIDNRPVMVVDTGDIYENSLECARAIDGLEELVLNTAMAGPTTTYMGLRIEFVRT